MNRPNFYFVTRQGYWHEEGACAVELCIAPSIEYSSPGMLSSRAGIPDGGEFDDPREAAREAVEIVLAWPACEGRIVIAGGLGLQYCYPGLDDPDVTFSPVQALMWGDAEWEKLPKCERCGDRGTTWQTIRGDDYMACDSHGEDIAYELVYGNDEPEDV